MLSLQPSASSKRCTPHLLPARLSHDGPINDTQKYWAPETSEDGTSHVYFRGRHLHGTTLPLPSTHTGAVLHTTSKTLPISPTTSKPQTRTEEDTEEGEDEEEQDADVNIIEQVGTFDEVMVWGHGGQVDVNQDVYARGLGEWVEWAGRMHGDEDEEVQKKA